MVTRVRSASDRRAVFVDITKKGREFVIGNPHILHNRLRKTLDKYSDAEQILMANAIEMVLGVLRESDARMNSPDWE
jgi:DNA-binding MarR family transcriptional regulator